MFYMRKLYLSFQKSGTLSHKLIHYYEILKSDSDLEISFYTRQCEKEKWSEGELKRQGDNEPVGILLGAYKDHILVEYVTGGITNKVLLAKYQLYLPDKAQLENALNKLLEV